jgi:hypothetical protein
VTLDDAINQLAEDLDVPVGNAALLAPNATERRLWAGPAAYVMVWPTDTGIDIQAVADDETYCAALAAEALTALGQDQAPPTPGLVTDQHRTAWAATATVALGQDPPAA